jgi:hypothetical protein
VVGGVQKRAEPTERLEVFAVGDEYGERDATEPAPIDDPIADP